MFRKSLKICFQKFSLFDGKKDYYKTLNINGDASKQQIKTSFRKLAKQYHPDANKGNEDKFKQLNQAYQVLSNQSTKRDYDNYRKQGSSSSYTSRPQQNYRNTQQQYYQRGDTYKGYQQQQGWQNRKFREETIYNMFKSQQDKFHQQYTRKSDKFTNHNQENFNNRFKTTNTRTADFQDQMNEMLRKNAEQIKITREQVRRAYQEQERRRQKQFKQYKDKQQEQFVADVKDKAWKMAQGIKQNLEGAVKAGKFVKENINSAMKVGKFVKELWNQYKDTKKK